MGMREENDMFQAWSASVSVRTSARFRFPKSQISNGAIAIRSRTESQSAEPSGLVHPLSLCLYAARAVCLAFTLCLLAFALQPCTLRPFLP